MSRQRSEARLLDAWIPPAGAGEPVGCLATSFTFDAAFFEDECLGRFVRMETDPNEDQSAVFLLEREEKLAELAYAGCIVDAHHCNGSRSLRWDLLRAYVPRGGVMHAKLSLLQWSHHVRVVVASGNLTESGYRRNREVFGVLDFRDGEAGEPEALAAVLDFLRDGLVPLVRASEPEAARLVSFLRGVTAQVEGWSTAPQRGLRIVPMFMRPGQDDLFAQVQQAAAGRTAFRSAAVVSPFFDRDGERNAPAERLWRDLLRQRGEADVTYHVAADLAVGDVPLCLHAPASLLASRPTSRAACTVTACAVFPQDGEAHRDLHAKGLWLESDDAAAYVVGSSNFTSAGTGIGVTVNVEANLAWLLSGAAFAAHRDAMWEAFPEGEPVDADAAHWLPADPAGTDTPEAQATALPVAFGEAVFCYREGQAVVEFTFDAPPSGWTVQHESTEEVLLDAARAAEDGLAGAAVVPWPHARPPTGFQVRWAGCDAPAWWPVTIRSPSDLPPPDELRNLPLRVLLDILTVARPLHRNPALQRYLAAKARDGEAVDAAATWLDPHKRVDTSAFLLQRTRQLSWALGRLRERLEHPFAGPHCLEWRLHGPVGVRSVAEAILRDAKSDEERAFLVAELVLELHRVAPRSAPACLPAAEIASALHALADELLELLPPRWLATDNQAPMAAYLREVAVAAGARSSR